jgi:DNA-binding transcriptional regulator YiaG
MRLGEFDMKRVFVKDFRDTDGLEPIVCDAWVHLLDDASVQLFDESGWSDSLDWGMDGAEIARLSRLSAEEFVRMHYKAVTMGQETLNSMQIKKIIDFLGLTYEEIGVLLGGMSKGTIANYVNGVRKAEGPSSALLMERLSLELVRPGALKAMLGKEKTFPESPNYFQIEMDKVRYNKRKIA